MTDEKIEFGYPEEGAVVANTVATRVARRWGPYVDADDLRQEAWTWMLDRVERANQALAPGGRRAGFMRHMERHLVSIAAREKAGALGYMPADETQYSRAIVEQFLPYVLHDVYHQPVTGIREGGPGGLASEGGDWLTMRTDVASAWDQGASALSDAERDVLEGIYYSGLTPVEYAAQNDLTLSAVYNRKLRALDKLCYLLNEPADVVSGPLPARPHGTADEQSPWR